MKMKHPVVNRTRRAATARLIFRYVHRSRRMRSSGFSMVAVFLALLAILATTATLVARTTEGNLGAIFTSQNYESRAAAEAGITQLIAEWNQVPNRMLLASGAAASNWVTSSTVLRNPCTATSSSRTSASAIGGSNLADFRSGNWINVVSGDSARQYRLRRVTFKTQDRSKQKSVFTQSGFGTDSNTTPAYPDMSVNTSTTVSALPLSLSDPAAAVGYFEVEMEGRLVRSGSAASTSRVVKEFQVVPKCCKNSFGRTLGNSSVNPVIHGNSTRRCSNFSGLGDGDLAIVTGLSGGGLSGDTGNAWQLRVIIAGTEQKVDPILCTTTSLTCDGTDSGTTADSTPVEIGSADGDIAVTPYNFVVPDPPLIPVSGFVRGPSDSTAIASLTSKSFGSNVSPNLPADGIAAATPYCGYRDGAFHCRLSEINLNGNNTITVDTTAAPVYLYLQDSPGNISLGGNEGLVHNYNGSPASANDALRFQIRGEPRGGTPSSQSFDLTGSSVNTSTFIWAPTATLELGGSSEYRGLSWVNNLAFSGSTKVVVPTPNGTGTCPENPSITDVYCTLYGAVSQQSTEPAGIFGAFDWIARSTNFTRIY